MTMFKQYQRLRDSFLALSNEFSSTGAAFGGLYYDDYFVLPGTVDKMHYYLRCLDKFFEDRFPETWTSWKIFDNKDAFGRIYGDRKAYEPFLRLASTGFDALRMIGELAAEEQAPEGTHVKLTGDDSMESWLRLLIETARVSPTAVLQVRRNNHRWLDDTGKYVDLVPDFLQYDHAGMRLSEVPIRGILANDLFKSSAEAIRLWLESSSETEGLPVILPAGPTATTGAAEEETRTAVGEATPKEEDRYIFRWDGVVWHMRFEEEEGRFPRSSRPFETIAKLLAEPGRPIDALELVREGVDVKREAAAKEAQGSDNPQSGVADDAVSEEAVCVVANEIADLLKSILAISEEPDIDRIDTIEALTTNLIKDYDFLNKATRDKAKMVSGSPCPPSEAGGKVDQETERGVPNRIDELMAQLEEACTDRDIKKIKERAAELLRCYNPNQQRRPRPLGDPGLMDSARKTVERRIFRAKEAIGEKMTHFAQHLHEKVIGVRNEPKWVYTGGIYWKVDTSSKP